MNRQLFEALVTKRYGVALERPFAKDQTIAVFRHAENRKWICAVMTLPRKALGMEGEERVDVVNLKCAPEMLDTLWQERGIYPAYHMSKGHWITVLLDGSVSDETLSYLLAVSFTLTAPKKRKQ
jgi:predicted DNA-binding protein (MmcQ/YjbR family)